MEESQFIYFYWVGGAIVVACWIWLLVVAFQRSTWWGIGLLVLPPLALVFLCFEWQKARVPFFLSLVGLLIFAMPPIYGRVLRLVPIELGEREKVVNGEMHLTLTGWNRNDYDVLQSKKDVVVLQMANPDVTDDTLKYLDGLTKLRELDLSHTKITDKGLEQISKLPALETLRLKNTQITDEGFNMWLAPMPLLRRLDLSQTQISRETAQGWRIAQEGRKVLQ